MPDDYIDATAVKKEMDVMVNMITHPAFVDAMKTLKSTPPAQRREVGKKILTVENLKKKGVDIPKGMRLTTRYFEPGRPGILEMLPDGAIRNTKLPNFPIGKLDPGTLDPGTLGIGGCACGGGLSFCGGAGGST